MTENVVDGGVCEVFGVLVCGSQEMYECVNCVEYRCEEFRKRVSVLTVWNTGAWSKET